MNPPNAKQQELIKANWMLVREKGLKDCAVDMFCRLFTAHPDLMPLFSFVDKESVAELRDSPRLARHASGVFRIVDGAVDQLDNLLDYAPKLVALGGRHLKYGISPDYFGPVAEALMATLVDVCGDTLTDEAKEGFGALYSIVQTTMLSGYNAAKGGQAKQ